MRRSEYVYLSSRLEDLRQRKQELLVEMELCHMTKSPEAFDTWWYEEGHFEECRKLSEEAERLDRELAGAVITEDETPPGMRGAAAGARHRKEGRRQ